MQRELSHLMTLHRNRSLRQKPIPEIQLTNSRPFLEKVQTETPTGLKTPRKDPVFKIKLLTLQN